MNAETKVKVARKLERLVRKQREKNRNYLKHREAGKLGWKRRTA